MSPTDGKRLGGDQTSLRDRPKDDDPQYIKARAVYMRLLRAGKLQCGVNCPLWAIDRCTYMCW